MNPISKAEEVMRWAQEYIERDRKERFEKGDKRADAAVHLVMSLKEARGSLKAAAND